MDSRKFKKRIQRRLYHACTSDCDSDSDIDGLSTSSLPLTETCMEYFQDSFPGSEGLGRLDMPMAATVTKRNQVSPCSVVLSMMYAKRLRQQNQHYLQSMSSSDVFFISMMMASKYLYDEGVDEEVYNDEWAASVGHETDDVNKMEMDFLKEMDWHLYAKPEDFDKALTAVERQLALREGVRRGWFTYTEMAVLLDWEPVCNLWNQVGVDCTKVVSLLSAAYVASVVSMMGSAAIALQLSGPMASATMAALLSIHTSISTTSRPSALPVSSVGVHHHHLPCNQSSSFDTIAADSDVGNVDLATEMMPLLVSSADKEFGNLVAGSFLNQNDSYLENGKSAETSSLPKNASCMGREQHTGPPGDREKKGDPPKMALFEKGAGSLPSLKRKHQQQQQPSSTSSVFSMWLFDSLISQLWSVFSTPTTDSAESTSTNTIIADRENRGLNGKSVKVGNLKSSRVADEVGKKCEHCGNLEENRRQKRGSRTRSWRRESESRSQTQAFRNSATVTTSTTQTTTTHDMVNDITDVDFIAVDKIIGNGFNEISSSAIIKGCDPNTAATTSTTTTSLPTTTTTTTNVHRQGFTNNPPVSNSNSCQFLSSDYSDGLRGEHGTKPTSHLQDNDSSSSSSLPTHGNLPPRHDNNNNNANLEFILPLSLMTEVPILDPVGFFTKNSSPTNTFILST